MKRYEVKQISVNWFGIWDNVKHEYVIETTGYGIKFYRDLLGCQNKCKAQAIKGGNEMKTMIPKTYEEAKAQGYSVAFLRYQRGYISRNTNIDKAPVMVAGGSRKGMLYVLVPCWQSTQYCQRMYLTK